MYVKKTTSTLFLLLFFHVISSFSQEQQPVIEIPQLGLDDTTIYRNYKTRFYRDSDGNAVQIYIQQKSGRVVHVWADAANESIGSTVRDSGSNPVPISWDSRGAIVTAEGKRRYLQHTLLVKSSSVEIGLFLLSSMRKERDFQYHQKHLVLFNAEPYLEEELIELLNNFGRLPTVEQHRHLSVLGATGIDELRSRLQPTVTSSTRNSQWVITVQQPTFDGKNLLSLELSDDARTSSATINGALVSIRSFEHRPISLTVRIGTDSPSLTPLTRNQIFNQAFFKFYTAIKGSRDTLRFQRLERQVRSVELLSYKEKLMAGLPNFATYFGRDVMMSAMMMESVWQPSMLEHVIASVLWKLSSDGQVSHEEALGGQAIRENAGEYNSLIKQYLEKSTQGNISESDRLLTEARTVLAHLQRVRENYLMVDDDFQIPVLIERYLKRTDVPDDGKRTFLLEIVDSAASLRRITLVMRNLLYIERQTRAFVAKRDATALVSFQKLDAQRWHSGSWRDSGAGYAGGRFAMDVNAIWVPKALEAMQTMFSTFHTLGIPQEQIESLTPEIRGTNLSRFMRNPESLNELIAAWRSAKEYFTVSFNPQETLKRVNAKLRWLSVTEQSYWNEVLRKTNAPKDGVRFLALSLDEGGSPIPVVNTDPATLLFLDNATEDILSGTTRPENVLEIVKVMVTPYPIGLFVEGLGPLVANDGYAPPEIWEQFKRDHYHSPHVVWGREVNLLLLGLSKQILYAHDEQGQLRDARLAPFVQTLLSYRTKIKAAAELTGLKNNELWSYRIEDGRLLPERYPTSADVQLWNLTDLAVQFSIRE